MSSKQSGEQTRRDKALKLFVTLSRASDSFLKSVMDSGVLDSRVSQTEFAILEALLFGGRMHQCDVASRILKSRGNISVAVQHLVEKQLVDRVPDPDDRRHTMISLTPTGRSLILEIFPQVAEAIEQTCSQFSDEEIQEYIRLNKKLGLNTRR